MVNSDGSYMAAPFMAEYAARYDFPDDFPDIDGNQVLDRSGDKGNYLESSCSAMFMYSLYKAVRKGYIDVLYKETHVPFIKQTWILHAFCIFL
jgi:rhamnogalacturonyl hydrolase YesR